MHIYIYAYAQMYLSFFFPTDFYFFPSKDSFILASP